MYQESNFKEVIKLGKISPPILYPFDKNSNKIHLLKLESDFKVSDMM